jgi:UDP-N-acetylglucosamine:LPS N-acetylglucosamine transferase
MPDSHQEDNAAVFLEKNAAVVLNQKNLDGDSFVAAIKELLDNQDKRQGLGARIKSLMREGANEEFAKIIKAQLKIEF